MASGAQLNKWGNAGGIAMLTCTSGASAQATTSYGTLGVNDSGAFVNPIGLTKWTFQLIGGGTGYSITMLGTIDPAVYLYHTTSLANPPCPANDPLPCSNTVVPASSWFVLPGPSEQSGTGGIANPLTAATPLLTVSMPLVAVRAVLTATGTLNGQVTVLGFAVP